MVKGMRSSRRRWAHGGVWAGAALIAAALALAGCSKGTNAANAAGGAGAMRAMPVAVTTLAARPVEQSSRYVATLKSRRSATIYSQVSGYIRRIAVRSGDLVRPGQLLMLVDPLKQQATVGSQISARDAQAATVQYDLQQLRRQEALFEAQVASRQDLDQARATYQAAKAQLEALDAQVKEQQVQLEYYHIAAPMEGIVGDIPVHVGDLVQDTTPLTTVDQRGPLQVYVYVPVEQAPRLKPGLPVKLLDANDNVVAQSRINFVSPQVDSATQTVLAKADVSDDQGRLRNLQFVTAEIVWGVESHITVPVLDVQRLNGMIFAFLAEPRGNGFAAAQVPIQVGPIVGNDYVVLSGLKPGDKLITSGLQFLVHGMPVLPMTGPPGGAPGAPGAPGAGARR